MRKRFHPSLPHTTEDHSQLQNDLNRSSSSILNAGVGGGPQHEKSPSAAEETRTSSTTRRVLHKLAGKRVSITDSKDSVSAGPPSVSASSSNQSTSPVSSPPFKAIESDLEPISMSKTKSNSSHFGRDRTHDIVTNVMDVRKTLSLSQQLDAHAKWNNRLTNDSHSIASASDTVLQAIDPVRKTAHMSEESDDIHETDGSETTSDHLLMQLESDGAVPFPPVSMTLEPTPASRSNLMLYLQQQSMYHNLMEAESLRVPFPLTYEDYKTIEFLSAIPITATGHQNAPNGVGGFKKRRYTLLGSQHLESNLAPTAHQPMEIQRPLESDAQPTIDIELGYKSTDLRDSEQVKDRVSLRHLTMPSPVSDSSRRATPYSVISGAKLSTCLNISRESTQRRLSESFMCIMLTSDIGTPLTLFSLSTPIESRTTVKRGKAKHLKTFPAGQFEKLGANLSIISENIKRKKAQSFSHHLTPSEFSSIQPQEGVYNPYFVDDPELKTGKNRTVITLPCFIGSIIPYAKPLDLKKELNQLFQSTHPNVDASLTLSQIRNLKTKMLQVGRLQDMELSSVAIAYVYFEKLALKVRRASKGCDMKGWVNKATRRLIAAVCLLLAAKVNDPKERRYSQLLETMEKILDVSPKEVYEQEFSVYSALEFTLFLPFWEIMPHLDRILSIEGKHPMAFV